ncbi:cytochrome-c peroxidase [Pontibacter sp. 13R65]|uniref:cytochrome-c peroxidase n=1 Tax=Pontibacter sp. 13R65 TaxID=3127458 RepID=UPI00301CF3C3
MAARRLFLILLPVMWLLGACSTEQELGQEPQVKQQEVKVPANFPALEMQSYNQLSEEGVELGRRLFYDTRLSGNNTLSCASCHEQRLAFTDGAALSAKGAAGTPLLRHSPGLANMAWMTGFFWDGGAKNLESQAFGPLTAPDEMDQNLQELVTELQSIPDYVSRFKLVFNDEIKAAYIGQALAQFQRTLVSAGSRYDKYVRQEPGGTMSELELQGLRVVRQKCGSCHTGELFTDNLYHNNGLDLDFNNEQHEGIYQGRYRISHNPADLGKYKTPTLRNIMLTAPYMHDGRFATISEVLHHYSQGVQVSATLAPDLLQGAGGAAGIPLTQQEQEAIVAFLETLTDYEFIQNPKLASPFKEKEEKVF